MRSLDIDFLLHLTEEPQIISGEEIQHLVKNVITVLRDNRGTGRLSDHEVHVGNRFILSMAFLFMTTAIELDIKPDDLDEIVAENEYMRMGNCRN